MDQMIASGALNLTAAFLFITFEMLAAMLTFKFEFAHGLSIIGFSWFTPFLFSVDARFIHQALASLRRTQKNSW